MAFVRFVSFRFVYQHDPSYTLCVGVIIVLCAQNMNNLKIQTEMLGALQQELAKAKAGDDHAGAETPAPTSASASRDR
jgi:hypothetical protein